MKKSLKLFAVSALFLSSGLIKSQCAITSAPTSNCSYGDGIQAFTLNSINAIGNSGCGSSGYNSFSAPVWTLTIGNTYAWSAAVGGGYYNEGVGIWIDLNNDGFYATSEFVASGGPAMTVTGNLTIPYGSTPNVQLRMRVRDAYSSAVTNGQACTNGIGFGYGETEDYYVYLVCPSSIPSPTVTGPTASVCANTSVSLTASGLLTYTWTGGVTNAVAFTASATTAYSVTAGIGPLCSATSSAVKTISVNPVPVISGITSSSICPAGSVIFTPGGAVSYTYISASGTLTGTSATVAPLVTTVYTVNGTSSQGCISNTATAGYATVTTLSSPTLVINASSPSVCPNLSTSLTVSGANTYTWTSPASNAATIAVNPSVTTVYTVSGTGTTVCNGVKTITVTVFPSPTVSVNSGTICSGYNFTMNPTGAATYTVFNTSGTVATVFSPTVTDSYTVLGTNTQGCLSSTTTPVVSTVVVNASPIITAVSGSVCAGLSYSLLPTGANTYSINSVSTNTNGSVIPATTTTYVVTGTGTNGCVSPTANVAVAVVTVVANPTVTISSSTPSVCAGQQSAVLTASGANTYTWSTSANTTSISVSPTSIAVYSVGGTSTLLCSSYTTIVIFVNNLPTLSTGNTNTFVCLGGSSTLSVGGASSYSWNTASTSTSIVVTPSITTSYTVKGTDNNGCYSNAVLSVEVNSLTLSVSPNTSICLGATATLSANGAVTYMWNNLLPFQTITPSPTVTTIYNVTAVDANNCPLSGSVSVSVFQLPNVSAIASSTLICLGESTSLTVSGANTYTWNTGSNATSLVVSPTLSILYNYSVTGTDNNGCKNNASVKVSVSPCTSLMDPLKSGENAVVYPNPNKGQFSVLTGNTEEKTIEVLDLTGRLVAAQRTNEEIALINLVDNANGIYYVRIISGQSTKVLKVVKQ